MFRVVYPAAVSIDAKDFNEAFKNAIKRQEFFNVEQMIIMDQLNQYKRANIMYSDIGGGKKKASIKHEYVTKDMVAPYIGLGVTIGADGKAQPSMAMPLGPGLPSIMVPLGTKDEPAATTAATTTATTTATEPAKNRVVVGPMGPMIVPSNGVSMQASVVMPGSGQLLNANPSLPIGTDGKPVIGMPMPFGVGGVSGVPFIRPGLIPGSGTPMGIIPGVVPMGRVW